MSKGQIRTTVRYRGARAGGDQASWRCSGCCPFQGRFGHLECCGAGPTVHWDSCQDRCCRKWWIYGL